MRATKRRTFRPWLELLEARLAPIGTLPWAVTMPAGTPYHVTNIYGQYVEAAASYFHAGLDIVSPVGRDITAIEGGWVRAVRDDPMIPDAGFIAIDSGGEIGWNYLHMRAINPATGNVWALNDWVDPGQVLGTTVARSEPDGYPNHLHIERAGGQDPYYATQEAPYTGVRRPVQDPLRDLTNAGGRNDEVDPTVADIKFRLADDDTNGAIDDPGSDGIHVIETPTNSHHYFTSTTPRGILIVGARTITFDFNLNQAPGSAKIDILADAWDRFKSAGEKIGVKTVRFSINGQKWGDSTGNVNSFYFGGEFLNHVPPLPPPAPQFPGHNHFALATFSLVRVVYENDRTADSLDLRDYWYIVTNTDGQNTIVTQADRDRYWNSKVGDGLGWNNNGVGVEAPNNAQSEFKDDFYTVRVWVLDETLRMGERIVTVLLDNWEQLIVTDKPAYNPMDLITVTGQQFAANQALPIYAATSNPTDGMQLQAGWLQGNATTDGNGNIVPFVFGPLPEGSRWVVADYNQNGVFDIWLDAVYQIVILNSVPPGGGGSGFSGPPLGGLRHGSGFGDAEGIDWSAVSEFLEPGRLDGDLPPFGSLALIATPTPEGGANGDPSLNLFDSTSDDGASLAVDLAFALSTLDEKAQWYPIAAEAELSESFDAMTIELY